MLSTAFLRAAATPSASIWTLPSCCAVFHNAVSYAVELRHLDANPIDRIGWKALAVAQTVDRRVVAGPDQNPPPARRGPRPE
jgi:hypothetical protein